MVRSVAILVFVVLAACAPTTALERAGEAMPMPERALLRIYNWDTYIDPQLLKQFEAETGARVIYRTFESETELLDTLRTRPHAYDLIISPDYAVERLRHEGALAPLNKAHIPNFANLDPLFVSPAYDPANRYCAPYLWGTIGIGYNAARVDAPIASWADLFNQPPGTVALLDSPREMLGATLLALGYSPNTTRPAEIAAARDALLARAEHFAGAAPDTGQDLLASGKVNAVVEWSGDILQVKAERPELQYVIPAEGSIIWTDNMCIPIGADQQALAERFINFILSPRAGAALANYTRYSTPNQAALTYIRPADRLDPTLYPDSAARERLFFLVDVGSVAIELYVQSWDSVLTKLPRQPRGR